MIPKETLSLLRRLQAGIGRWPVDSSRKGRDLGEFLRSSYQQKFNDLLKTNPVQAEAAVRSLERLVSDHHRNTYIREKNYSVLSEEEIPIEKIASEVLSNKYQEVAKEGEQTKSLWRRLTGR